MANLESRFYDAMVDICKRAKDECGYPGTYFLQMVNEYGGLETARRLLHEPIIQKGFTDLWELGGLDFTLEALVLQPEWAPLFSGDERAIARKRLLDHNYEFPEE